MIKAGFLRRWSRLKSQGDSAPAEPHAPATAPDAGAYPRAGDVEFPSVAQTATHPPVAPPPAPATHASLPTLDDVAKLGADSDFSAFVSQGVDKNVQRLAMKKLFSDPHFNVMDGLDIYIDDYNKADPIPAAMMASLQHAKSMFARFIEDDGAAPPGPGTAPRPDDHPDPPPRSDA
jgi:hypothetical protein